MRVTPMPTRTVWVSGQPAFPLFPTGEMIAELRD